MMRDECHVNICPHLLNVMKMFTLPWTASKVSVPCDGCCIKRHGLGLGSLAVNILVTVDAVDLVIRTIGEVCWIHLMTTRVAGETLPVITA